MRRIYYYVDPPQSSRTPIHEIAYLVGRVIGYAMLFGAGYRPGHPWPYPCVRRVMAYAQPLQVPMVILEPVLTF